MSAEFREPILQVDELSFHYQQTDVVHDISFQVPSGSLLTLLGPSGCGKTTILKLLGGYLSPRRGRILLGDRDVTRLPPEARQMGMVFQNYALFPHLSVRKNVAFGLEVRGVARTAVRERVESMLDQVGLDHAARDRFPAQLSGGQQQRVALARALAFGPDVLLLDEPFTSLDRLLREQLRRKLRQVQRELGITTVLVTHDQEEALAISDFIGVIHDGRLLQYGPPRELFEHPRGELIARAVGHVNFVSGELFGHPAGSRVLIRPEKVRLGGPYTGRITDLHYRGADLTAAVDWNGAELQIRCPPDSRLSVGDALSFDIAADSTWLIHSEEAGE